MVGLSRKEHQVSVATVSPFCYSPLVPAHTHRTSIGAQQQCGNGPNFRARLVNPPFPHQPQSITPSTHLLFSLYATYFAVSSVPSWCGGEATSLTCRLAPWTAPERDLQCWRQKESDACAWCLGDGAMCKLLTMPDQTHASILDKQIMDTMTQLLQWCCIVCFI